MLCTLIIIFIVLAIYAYFTWNNNYWKDRDVPFAQPTFFFGNFKDVLSGKKHFGEMYADLYRQINNASYIGYFKLREPSILIRDPELIKSVMVKDFANFEKNDFEVDGDLDPILKKNIFTQDGEEWKKNRTAWTLGLTSSKLKAMFDNMNNKCDVMVSYIKNHIKNKPDEPLEAKDLASSLFTDIIVTSIFGLEINSFEIKDNPFKTIPDSFFLPSFKDGIVMLSFIIAPWLSKVLKLRFVSKKIENLLNKLAKDILVVRAKMGFQKNNPFDVILQAEQKDKKTLEMDVAGLMFNFLVDGTETSAGVAGFILYALAANPHTQIKLRKELEASAAENEGKITYDSIHQLPYLDMVISETMRLYPPALGMQKVCSKPFVFPPAYPGGKSLKIDVGMPVTIPVYGLHMDPEYFPNPEVFDPERFNEENKGNIKKYTYLPFGEGPRVCIGQRLALNQLKMAIFGIVHNFEIRLAPKMQKPIQIESSVLVYRAMGGLWLTFHNLDK